MIRRPVAAANSPRMTGLRRELTHQTLILHEIMHARDSVFRAFCFSEREDDPRAPIHDYYVHGVLADLSSGCHDTDQHA